MESYEIQSLRKRLRLNQPEFAQLFGVHPMTVSRWERGKLPPNAYQGALMTAFGEAARANEVGDTLKGVLVGVGIAAALFLLLSNARG